MSKTIERMRAVDPNYGDQEHQRQFAERMDRLQELAPCDKDHDHSHKCYPKDLVAQVTTEQIASKR